MAEGAVLVNGEAAQDTKAGVREGDEITVRVPQAEETVIAAQNIPLDVIYEDADLIVVNKPAGMVVHPAPGSRDGTLVNALLHHCGDDLSGVGGVKRPGIVHRIDKDTSGILVVAKSDAAHHGLAEQFARHTIQREYWALVYGTPSEADPRLHGVRGTSFEQGGILRINTQLARHKTDRQRQAVTFMGGKHAITRARVVQSFGAVSLVECWLETGRTHQIRVHMSHVGHGLIGDPVYGGRRKLAKAAFSDDLSAQLDGFGRQALHARSLGFTHPISGDWMEFSADLPEDMQGLLDALAQAG